MPARLKFADIMDPDEYQMHVSKLKSASNQRAYQKRKLKQAGVQKKFPGEVYVELL